MMSYVLCSAYGISRTTCYVLCTMYLCTMHYVSSTTYGMSSSNQYTQCYVFHIIPGIRTVYDIQYTLLHTTLTIHCNRILRDASMLICVWVCACARHAMNTAYHNQAPCAAYDWTAGGGPTTTSTREATVHPAELWDFQALYFSPRICRCESWYHTVSSV